MDYGVRAYLKRNMLGTDLASSSSFGYGSPNHDLAVVSPQSHLILDRAAHGFLCCGSQDLPIPTSPDRTLLWDWPKAQA